MEYEDIRAGRMLGRYELLVPIAMGGTAQVWAARMRGPRGFEKTVAIKLLLAELLNDPDAETMFLDEARTLSRIHHPNVAEVLDLGEEEGLIFIVMEWIDGEPLHILAREAARAGGIPLQVALRIAKQACGGLHAAHELRGAQGEDVGLVHRDVSPQNILVGYDGLVKVIDFGVAKASSNMLHTSVGQMKGKVAYMAPEQALGDPVDRRTDIFGMGIVLYHLVTGKHPFRGDNEFVTLGRIRDKGPVDPPRSIVPSLSPDIDAMISRALSKQPNDRFPNMLEFQKAVERVCPTTLDGNQDIVALMSLRLGARGERKRAAIREAILLVDEHRAVPTAVPLAFDFTKTIDTEDLKAALSVVPPPPAPPPPPARAPAPAPPAQIPIYSSSADETVNIPVFRAKRSNLVIIAVLVIAAAIVAGLILGDEDPQDPGAAGATGGDAPTKKPW